LENTIMTQELTNGRWLGNSPNVRGIFRHYAPEIDAIKFQPGIEVVFHTMVTSVGYGVVGELIRWVADDGEAGYEVQINGLEEHYGISDAAAYSISSLAGLAKVANDLRYEWEIITGVYPDINWSVL
jgi:hypothetical protein